MSQLIAEVEIYNSTDGISKELRTDAGSSVTLTTYGNGSATFECSSDSGKTWYERFVVNMANANCSPNLDGEGMYLTIVIDVDMIRVSNVTGFDKIIASIA